MSQQDCEHDYQRRERVAVIGGKDKVQDNVVCTKCDHALYGWKTIRGS